MTTQTALPPAAAEFESGLRAYHRVCTGPQRREFFERMTALPVHTLEAMHAALERLAALLESRQ